MKTPELSIRPLLASLLASALVAGCISGENPDEAPPTHHTPPSARVDSSEVLVRGITKYYKDYRSAYSPTYDTPHLDGPEMQWLVDQGLTIDLEMVSDLYDKHPKGLDTLKSFIRKGFGYFGHGHTHVDHDKLSFAEAFASFDTNFQRMTAAGLKPVSYAYPGGYGFEAETHLALKNAGFLAGRLSQHWSDPKRPVHTLAGQDTAPANWYMLPALYMQDIGYEDCKPCINNPEEFYFYLDASVDQRGWLISVYHAIGWDGVRHPKGWGYYNLENFYKEMLMAKALRDKGLLWIASMDDVVLYTKERNATSWHLIPRGKWDFDFHLVNDLDKARFNHPLTLRLTLPRSVGKRLRITPPGSTVPLVDTVLQAPEILVDLVPSEKPYDITIR